MQSSVLVLSQRFDILLESTLEHNLLRPFQQSRPLTHIAAIAALTDLARVHLAAGDVVRQLVPGHVSLSMHVLSGGHLGWGRGVLDVAPELRVVLLAQLVDLYGQVGLPGRHRAGRLLFL